MGCCEVIRREDIVIIDEHDQRSARLSHAAVPGVIQSEFFFTDDAACGLKREIEREGFERGRRGVVNQQQLPAFTREGLLGEASEHPREVVGTRVVRADDDREKRRAHVLATVAGSFALCSGHGVHAARRIQERWSAWPAMRHSPASRISATARDTPAKSRCRERR